MSETAMSGFSGFSEATAVTEEGAGPPVRMNRLYAWFNCNPMYDWAFEGAGGSKRGGKRRSKASKESSAASVDSPASSAGFSTARDDDSPQKPTATAFTRKQKAVVPTVAESDLSSDHTESLKK